MTKRKESLFAERNHDKNRKRVHLKTESWIDLFIIHLVSIEVSIYKTIFNHKRKRYQTMRIPIMKIRLLRARIYYKKKSFLSSIYMKSKRKSIMPRTSEWIYKKRKTKQYFIIDHFGIWYTWYFIHFPILIDWVHLEDLSE